MRVIVHRGWIWLLSLVILLCACGAQPAEPTQPTWQEQYDLGMRYLSESDYEEAILAFTAAIEIDPRQVSAYLQLAEAYLSAGKTDQALNILRQGFEATGDRSLEERLKNLEQELAFYLPDPSFAQREGFQEFLSLPQGQQRFIEQAVTLLEEKRTEELSALVSSVQTLELFTMYKGYKIQMVSGPNLPYERYAEIKGAASMLYSFGPGLILQIRPENGTGYLYCYYSKLSNSEEMLMVSDFDLEEIIRCPCEDWQFDGEYEVENQTSGQYYVVINQRDTQTGENVLIQESIESLYRIESSFEGTASRNAFTRQRGRMISTGYDSAGSLVAQAGSDILYHTEEGGAGDAELTPIEGMMGLNLGDIRAETVTIESW